MEDFPPSATKIIDSSGLLNKMELIQKNWDTFLFVLRFLTRKIYRTPGKKVLVSVYVIFHNPNLHVCIIYRGVC